MDQVAAFAPEVSAGHVDSPAVASESENGSGRIHGNSAAVKAAKALRCELLAHVGGNASATEAAMIDQLAQLKLRLATMDEQFRRTGRRSPHGTRDYLSWSNSFSRLLKQLGLKGQAKPTLSLGAKIAAGPATYATNASTSANASPGTKRDDATPANM